MLQVGPGRREAERGRGLVARPTRRSTCGAARRTAGTGTGTHGRARAPMKHALRPNLYRTLRVVLSDGSTFRVPAAVRLVGNILQLDRDPTNHPVYQVARLRDPSSRQRARRRSLAAASAPPATPYQTSRACASAGAERPEHHDVSTRGGPAQPPARAVEGPDLRGLRSWGGGDLVVFSSQRVAYKKKSSENSEIHCALRDRVAYVATQSLTWLESRVSHGWPGALRRRRTFHSR